MREPASRTRRTRSASCRGRSRMHTVSSGTGTPRAFAMCARLVSIGAVEVDDVGQVAGAGDLLHVDARARVEHRVALGHRDDGQGVGQALGRQRGAVHGVDGEVDLRAGAVADVLAVVEHRRFVLLALADDDGAAHGDRVEDRPHGVDGGLVDDLLVAAPEVAGRGERRGLGGTDELQREVAVDLGPDRCARLGTSCGCRSLAVHLPCGAPGGAQLLDGAGARGRPGTGVDTSGWMCPAGASARAGSRRPGAGAGPGPARPSRAWPRARERGCARR